MREVRNIAVDPGEDGIRLDRWFRRRWPHVSQIQVQKLARSGQIRVDGARVKADQRLAGGVMVRVPPLPDAPKAGEKPGLDPRDIAYAKSLVIYEDEEVLVLNKPSGLAVQGVCTHFAMVMPSKKFEAAQAQAGKFRQALPA